MMMAAARNHNPDLIPGAPWWANLIIKLGAFGILAGLLYQNNLQTDRTATTLLSSNLRALDRLPAIAEKMTFVAENTKNESSSNAIFMREHTATAVVARQKTDTKLMVIDEKLTTILEELVSIRLDQERAYQLFAETLKQLVDASPKMQPKKPASPPKEPPKNSTPFPMGSTGDGLNG